MSDERRERYAARMAGFLGHIPEDGPIPDVFLATAREVMALADKEIAAARAEVLREAADGAEQTFIHSVTPAASERDELWDDAARAIAAELRRMAKEADS